MTDIPGLPARRAALQMLDAVLRQGKALDQVSAGALRPLGLAEDRALALALAGEVLRWLPDLDDLIDGATNLRLADDAKARMVLRLMLAQALRLGTPPHAVVATSLPLLLGGPRRLAHGVFGTLMRSGQGLPDTPALPDGVAMRWHGQWGDAMLEGASGALADLPPVDLSWRAEAFAARDADALSGQSFAPCHLRIERAGAVEKLPGFAEGAWWVQDLAASIPARLLGAGDGREVLDLCAAPGGKTMQLADDGWQVTAVDQSKHRLDRLRENLKRTGMTAKVVEANLLNWQPKEPVDAILLDAPCSATGIFRRHPDVLYRSGPRQIAEMADLQAQLLDRAAGWLKPGGVMVYAVCSLEQAEGEAQLAAFLERTPDFTLDPVRVEELPTGLVPTAAGHVRTLPTMLADSGRLDGFFIARLVRQS